MLELINVEIKDIAPEKVYIFPKKLTKAEINNNVTKLHTIANEESDRTIYCLFDEKIMNSSVKFEVCFPVAHLDLKKYKIEEFKVLQREKAICCDFDGDFTKLTSIIEQLTEKAKEEGYLVKPPYRYLFTLHKKAFFSMQPPKFTMQINLPIEKI